MQCIITYITHVQVDPKEGLETVCILPRYPHVPVQIDLHLKSK